MFLSSLGIIPDPERRRRGDWLQFIDTQQYITAATDFAHAELATEYGLEWRHLLFFMAIGSREVRCGGIAHEPDRHYGVAWGKFFLGRFIETISLLLGLSDVSVPGFQIGGGWRLVNLCC